MGSGGRWIVLLEGVSLSPSRPPGGLCIFSLLTVAPGGFKRPCGGGAAPPPATCWAPRLLPDASGVRFLCGGGGCSVGGPSPQACVSAAACHRAGRRQMTQMNLQTQISAESPEVDRWAN